MTKTTTPSVNTFIAKRLLEHVRLVPASALSGESPATRQRRLAKAQRMARRAVVAGVADHDIAKCRDEASTIMAKANARSDKAQRSLRKSRAAINDAQSAQATTAAKSADLKRRWEVVEGNLAKAEAQVAATEARKAAWRPVEPELTGDFAAMARETDDPDLRKAFAELALLTEGPDHD